MTDITHKPAPVYWTGRPTHCDVCARALGNTFVDGKLRQGGWAIADLECHRIHGLGVGPGSGQVYARQDDGYWLKIEG